MTRRPIAHSLASTAAIVVICCAPAQAYVDFGEFVDLEPAHLVPDDSGNWLGFSENNDVYHVATGGQILSGPTAFPQSATGMSVHHLGSSVWLATYRASLGGCESVKTSDFGASWSAPSPILAGGVVCVELLDVDGSNLSALVRGSDIDDLTIVDSTDAGDTWVVRHVLTPPPFSPNAGSTGYATDWNGNWSVVWTETISSPSLDSDLWSTHSVDDGLTWSSPQRVAGAPGDDGILDRVTDLVYLEQRSEFFLVSCSAEIQSGFGTADFHDITISRSADGGATWAPLQTITEHVPQSGFGRCGGEQVITRDSDRLFILSSTSRSKDQSLPGGGSITISAGRLTFLYSTDAGLRWSPLTFVQVNNPFGFQVSSSPVSASVDAAGNLVVSVNRVANAQTLARRSWWSAPACAPDPLTTCVEQARSKGASVKFKARRKNAANGLRWRLLAGPGPFADLGDPLVDAGYSLCMYETVGGAAKLVAQYTMDGGGAVCGAKPCWKNKPGSYRYADKEQHRGGVRKATMREKGTGVQFAVSGAKHRTQLPPMPPALDPTLTIQLVADASGNCWSSEYAEAKKADTRNFSSKSD